MNAIKIKSLDQNQYFDVLTHLFFLIVHADGKVSEKELQYGEKIILHEKLSAEEFSTKLKDLAKIGSHELIYNRALGMLRKLPKEKQVKCIAWLCLTANSDGFMDPKEWAFIYDMYAKELNLTTAEVMGEQQRIHKELKGATELSFGIKVNS